MESESVSLVWKLKKTIKPQLPNAKVSPAFSPGTFLQTSTLSAIGATQERGRLVAQTSPTLFP
jgi:hypothetical protein